MKFEQVEALAWDLDGTLIDSFELYCHVITEIARNRGLPPLSKVDAARNYHGTLGDSLAAAFPTVPPDQMGGIAEEFIDIQEKHYEEDVDRHFFEDAVRLVHAAEIMGLRQVVITNREHGGRRFASPRSIIERSVIAGFIHEIRCGDEVKARKPDPRSLDDWLASQQLSPDRLLVVGDQFVDAQLAVNLGSRAVLAARSGEVHHINQTLESNPESVFLVDTLDEVEL